MSPQIYSPEVPTLMTYIMLLQINVNATLVLAIKCQDLENKYLDLLEEVPEYLIQGCSGTMGQH